MANLDEKIAKARDELLKLRETIITEGDTNQKKLDELKMKKALLDKKQREVLEQGPELTDYAAIMKKVNEKDTAPFNSIAFGHQVLLLNTVHLMECREMAVRTSAKQGKKIVKFVERRKRALLEQNANNELHFANQLGEHYEKMKNLEEEYRQVIAAQQKAFWKIQSTAFPMIDLQPPTLAASTTDFVKEHRHFITTSSTDDVDRDRRTAKREASMRNLMVIENTATEIDALRTDGNGSRLARRMTDSSTESFPSHIEFSMSLKDNSDSTPKNTPKNSRRIRRDSVDTLSTAGEELLNSIQGYFFGGGNKSANAGQMSDSDCLTLDDSARDWASMHGRERRKSTTGESAALIV